MDSFQWIVLVDMLQSFQFRQCECKFNSGRMKLVHNCLSLLSYHLSFAGHGGARAAEFVKHLLFSNLIKHPKFIADTKSAIGLCPLRAWLVNFFLL